MRILASFTAALLFMFLLVSAPTFAQDDKPDHAQDQQQKDKDAKSKPDAKQDDKARQDETKRDESRPATKQDNTRPDNARPENARPEAARPQEQTRPEQRDDHAMRDDRGGNAHPAQGQKGQRIPDDKFRSSFGREHHFRVQRTEIVNQAQPQVVYGGYTFVLQQPWPSEWSYDDDCYIDYVDGSYYLIDLNHPGIQILVFVTG